MPRELPISDEAVQEATGIVVREVARPSAETWQETMRRAIAAFLQAEGFEVETRVASSDIGDEEARLVSPWKPAPSPAEEGER